MKPVDDGLFAHIKESLAEHEEAYVPGAWERFNKKQRIKTGWPWFAGLGSAAAALLIGFAIFFSNQDERAGSQQHVKTSHSKRQTDTTGDVIKQENTSGDVSRKLEIPVSENRNVVKQRTINQVVNSPLIVASKIPGTAKTEDLPSAQAVAFPAQGLVPTAGAKPGQNKLTDQNKVTGLIADSAVVANVRIEEKSPENKNKPRSFQDFLDEEVKANSTAAIAKPLSKKADKWDMGLMVAPSVGNSKKLNIGYGLSMGYALSDKVSISSGISYNAMSASKSVANTEALNSPTDMAVVSDTKSLQSVDASLVGIDIPLGIKYYLTKKFYTNVGVSAFAILTQKQSNNYLQGAVEYSATDQNNLSGFKAVFQTRAVSEPVPEAELKTNKYLGFYNISFGFQQKISDSKSFSVEPFMKLPMKEFTKENLYLIGTGLRLRFDF